MWRASVGARLNAEARRSAEKRGEAGLAMHENELSERIIGAAIAVHKYYGPGLVEQVYEEALCHEFSLRGIKFERQRSVPIFYKEVKLGVPLRLDLIVEEKVIVDLKAKEEVTHFDRAKLLSYLRLSGLKLGLIVNFHELVLKKWDFAGGKRVAIAVARTRIVQSLTFMTYSNVETQRTQRFAQGNFCFFSASLRVLRASAFISIQPNN